MTTTIEQSFFGGEKSGKNGTEATTNTMYRGGSDRIVYFQYVVNEVYRENHEVFGQENNGARNWISLGGISFQPSELVKLCFLYVGASTMDRIVTKRNLFLFIVYSAAICGCLALMNDFGTALIFFVAFLVIAFLRSGSFATVTLACAATGFAGVLAVRFRPHILRRFATWGHAWEYASATSRRVR